MKEILRKILGVSKTLEEKFRKIPIITVKLRNDYKEFKAGTVLFQAMEGRKVVFDLINTETNRGYTFPLEEIKNNELFEYRVRDDIRLPSEFENAFEDNELNRYNFMDKIKDESFNDYKIFVDSETDKHKIIITLTKEFSDLGKDSSTVITKTISANTFLELIEKARDWYENEIK